MHRNFPQFLRDIKNGKCLLFQTWNRASLIYTSFYAPISSHVWKLRIPWHSCTHLPNASLAYAAILWRVKSSWHQFPVLITGSWWTSFSWWFPVTVLQQSRQLVWLLQTEGMKLCSCLACPNYNLWSQPMSVIFVKFPVKYLVSLNP